MAADIRDGVEWKPYYVRVAQLDGRKVVLIDSTKLAVDTAIRIAADVAHPAYSGTASRADIDKRYGVRWGPSRCRHVAPCPFPDVDHADELLWTNSRKRALAAFHEAEQRLLDGTL